MEKLLIGEYCDDDFREYVDEIEENLIEDFYELVNIIHKDTIDTVYSDCLSDGNTEEMQKYLDVHREVTDMQMITNDIDELASDIQGVLEKANNYINHVLYIQTTLTVKDLLPRYTAMTAQLVQFVVRKHQIVEED